jgi:NADPH-dependent glutamate synthase beta subunit-like oxidoreductase
MAPSETHLRPARRRFQEIRTRLRAQADLVLLAMGFVSPGSGGLLEDLGVAFDPRRQCRP